jgi:hypothetical protein
MLDHPSLATPVAGRALVAIALTAAVGHAQHPSSSHTMRPMGTYAEATTSLPRSGKDGCWLEAAPVAADSMHIQFFCRRPAPGHHLGALDARLPLRGDTLVYERSDLGDHCRIRVRFADGRAFVTQDGSDQACGFGAYVDVSGTYVRLDKRRPPFDLAPIERASAKRPPT